MHAKAHCHRKEGEKHPDVLEEILDSAPVNALVSDPIATKENDRTNCKSGDHVKIPAVGGIVIFNV